MLPWIVGAVVMGVGAYLLDEAESSNNRARDNYDDTAYRSKQKLKQKLENAQKKDNLDKLFKMKRAKIEIADAIYMELKTQRESLVVIKGEIRGSKQLLATLFEKKHIIQSRSEKRVIQQEINSVIASRKELFAIKDTIKPYVAKLQLDLKEANGQTRAIQESINHLRDS